MYAYEFEAMGLTPKDSDRYNLTLNGVLYENLETVWNDNAGSYVAGNLALAGLGNDTGEDYLLAISESYNRGYVMVITPTAGDYTVSLELVAPMVETIHKIDSKYLDVDVEVPYTVDNEGNVVFENDVVIDGSTSVREMKNSVETLQSDISELQEDIVGVNEELANQGAQLNEGIICGSYDGNTADWSSKGLSANRDAYPTASKAWIEGAGAKSIPVYRDSVSGVMGGTIPYLSVTKTTNSKSTITTVKVIIPFSLDGTSSSAYSKLSEMSYLSLVFTDEPDNV